MNELFNEIHEDLPPIQTQRLFVDEAGDPTLFHSSGKPIVGTEGCSGFFIIGKLEVDDPPALSRALTGLRQEMLGDSYFAGVESFRPERKKTALLFHAKDDLPEVRYRVFNLLRSAGSALRFHAIVRDKQDDGHDSHKIRQNSNNRETAIKRSVSWRQSPPHLITIQYVRIGN